MKLIVGLGNFDQCYNGTRHNIGFRVIDAIAKNMKIKEFSYEFNAFFAVTETCILAKPTFGMNFSGIGVMRLAQHYNIPVSNIIVVHEEMVFPLGTVRIKFGGRSAGHKGIESIIKLMGTDFWRIRIGIGNPVRERLRCGATLQPKDKEEIMDFLLSKFNTFEEELAEVITKKCATGISILMEDSLVKAQNFLHPKINNIY